MTTTQELRVFWRERADKHREKREFLRNHNFEIQAQIEDGLYQTINSFVMDLEQVMNEAQL